MTIELTPNGVACNLQCPYCYQDPMRDAGNVSTGYNMLKMKEGLRREGGAFTIFGGEPLLLPLVDLEELFRFGLESYGSNSIQTNGTLITEAHLRLFDQYRVQVGFSLDGPGRLNESRWCNSPAETTEMTQRSMTALRALCTRGRPPSVIITLYRGNAVGASLDALIDWLREIESLGVRYVRIHLLEVEDAEIAQTMAMTADENIAALQRLYAFQKTTQIQFDLFSEIARLLLGDDQQSTCIWNACDPYTTAAVRGVDGQGVSSNCGRTNKEGVNWQKADTPGYERQIALYHTPQSDLGCKDCRFFFACKGQCPGTAEHGDWRNRSEHCAIWMALFTQIEGDLRGLGREPLSLARIRPQIEAVMLDAWHLGQNLSITNAVQVVTGQPPSPCADGKHGDHWDAPDGMQHSDGAWEVHGDKGTTDVHGDSGPVTGAR